MSLNKKFQYYIIYFRKYPHKFIKFSFGINLNWYQRIFIKILENSKLNKLNYLKYEHNKLDRILEKYINKERKYKSEIYITGDDYEIQSKIQNN